MRYLPLLLVLIVLVATACTVFERPDVETHVEEYDIVSSGCSNKTLLLMEAWRMEPPEGLPGVKRNAYSLLYAANMYTVTHDDRYLDLASKHAVYLLEKQEEDGGWREVEGEVTSSYALLETTTATWALSHAYTRGVLSGEEIERSIIRGGDALLNKARLLTFFGYRIGLKPNAVGFLVLGLEKAGEAAEKMDDLDRVSKYREKAVRIGSGLVSMQREDGAWYDGPYRLPIYPWTDISVQYQGMALSGTAAAYAASPPELRNKFRASTLQGLAFFDEMKRAEGGYYGAIHGNGTHSGEEYIMVLQSFAVAESFGIPAGCRDLEDEAPEVKGWDANYAFAVSQLLVS
jgi:hypothetical protein